MLVLGEADVEALLDRRVAIELADEAYRLHSRGAAAARATLLREAPRAGCLLLAGADEGLLSVKSNVHAQAGGPDVPRAWGSLVTLWDLSTCRPAALLSARAFNEHRTAAGLAAAARFLKPEARRLAVFGAGKSAPEAIRYLRLALPQLEAVDLVGRNPARVAALAARATLWPDCAGLAVRVAPDAAAAAAGADIIATVTTSEQPVFPGAAARPGTLVILAGANRPSAREADDALMRRARVICDDTAASLEKAGDLLLARRSGSFPPEAFAGEIGALLDGAPAGPRPDITVFKSTGLALQDLTLARHLVARAAAEGRGSRLALDEEAGT